MSSRNVVLNKKNTATQTSKIENKNRAKLLKMLDIKGTVSVISSDPPCKDGNGWFTTVPLIILSDQV